MSEYDQVFDPNILIGHCDLISRFSDFALYLDTQLVYFHTFFFQIMSKKVQVGKDQEKSQSEKDSHSKNRGGKKKPNQQSGTYTMKTFRKPNEQLFSQ